MSSGVICLPPIRKRCKLVDTSHCFPPLLAGTTCHLQQLVQIGNTSCHYHPLFRSSIVAWRRPVIPRWRPWPAKERGKASSSCWKQKKKGFSWQRHFTQNCFVRVCKKFAKCKGIMIKVFDHNVMKNKKSVIPASPKTRSVLTNVVANCLMWRQAESIQFWKNDLIEVLSKAGV